jgi:hypothetical protein
VKSLKQKDFEMNSTIPISTVKYHLGSWNQALKEAELKINSEKAPSAKKDTITEEQLLLELVRIHEETGEAPTTALIDNLGKYSENLYKKEWGSLSEAFRKAKKLFPERFSTPEIKDFSISLDDVEESLEYYDTPGQTGQVEEKPMAEKKIKFIPQTIKPKGAPEKSKFYGEPIDFRGLRFAPISKQGVVYLFGLISYELGFLIESFRSEFPDCEGKRCLDVEENRWEYIRIQFEYNSSDFKEFQSRKGECDIVVCWKHDWDACPLEVLELSSVVAYLK